MDHTRLRVLVIAHELSPIKGSECAEGWNVVTRLAKYHHITVIYASGSQFGKHSYFDAVQQYIQTNGPIQNLTFVNIDMPRVTKIIASLNSKLRSLSTVGLPVLYYIGYKYWHKAAFREAIKLHNVNNFQVVHQLTQITFREPGYTWKLGVPFFWGPTGGTNILPIKFYSLLKPLGVILELIRSLSNYYQFNFNSRITKATKIASCIYAFSLQDLAKFKKRASGEIKVMLDAGTYDGAPIIEKEESNGKLKGIWCGQLNERKAPSILLKALSMHAQTRELVTMQIIGKGPLKKSLVALAQKLNLTNIEWIENVSHDDVFKLMGQADFLVHTSLREATTNVIPEALSMGLPIICHDINGMSIAVNESCGIKIPFISPETSIMEFNNAFRHLISDKDYLTDLKNGAKTRALEISWNAMAETIANDYINVVTLESKNHETISVSD